ncbi:hypothetical protein MNBD_GAMMA12-3909 [hydrothermal vent metagenome]|uniref:Uncharacterized protein n=1 Tax=hydrothermal vent metagenome TaxID=652676 RepID=A0A3B0YS06_9ZZZZ
MITDYIKNNGTHFKYSLLSYIEAKINCSEYWENNGGSIITITEGYYDFEIMFNNRQVKTGEQIVCHKISSRMISTIDAFKELFIGVYSDKGEVVILLNNGINIHFTKYADSDYFNSLIIVPNTTEISRCLIKNTLGEVNAIELTTLIPVKENGV